MPIVTTDVPITSRRNTELIQLLVEKYPFLSARQFGTTAFGRPLWALTVGNGERQVLYTAAHHANEWITAYVLLKFAEELAQAISDGGSVYGIPANTIANAATITLVPLVNPDGVDLVTGAVEPDSPQYLLARALGVDGGEEPLFADGREVLIGLTAEEIEDFCAKWDEFRRNQAVCKEENVEYGVNENYGEEAR